MVGGLPPVFIFSTKQDFSIFIWLVLRAGQVYFANLSSRALCVILRRSVQVSFNLVVTVLRICIEKFRNDEKYFARK